MKKICFLFLVIFLSVILAIPINANTEGISISAKSAVLIEAESGTVLYKKNAHLRLPMASTTKIMTALVAIERGELDKTVRIDPRACGIEGSSIYMTDGEELSLRSLLYALMLASANDAAAAIAYEISGSIESFAELMNEKARELGLKSTHFTNPHGLADSEHYTSAYDLAIITAEALKNEEFLKICSTKQIAIPMSDGGQRYLTNHNKMLRLYDGAIGVKTGFTKNSGRCLVSAAERDGLKLIAVTLNAPDDWNDHKSLLDFGFNNYKRVLIAGKGEFTVSLDAMGGDLASVIVTNSNKMSAFTPKDNGELTYKIEVTRPIFAPVRSGKIVGEIKYYYNDKLVASSPLVAIHELNVKEKSGPFTRIKNLLFG